MSENAYKQAGVDVEAGYESVRLIKDDVKKTAIEGVLGGIGGFGGLFEMPKNYENPVLVSGTDGVGTKIRVAFLMDKHDTIGQDCVAMCVNDIAQLLNTDLPRVFDKSFTGENGHAYSKATGMGMYIVKNLCEKLGHKITIESVKGEYTLVSIEFFKNDFYKETLLLRNIM